MSTLIPPLTDDPVLGAPSMAPGTPLTTTGLDPTSQLGAILGAIQKLQSQPVVPDHPMAQLGTILAGFGAGVQGKPNPVLEHFQQQRRQDVAGLATTATIAGTMANLQDKAQERDEQRKAQALKWQVDLTSNLLKDSTDPAARTAALRQLRDLGVVKYDDATLKLFAESGTDKTVSDRLKMVVGAIDAGLEPSAVGVNTTGIDVAPIRAMKPEDRAALFGAESRDKFLQSRERQIDVDTKKMVFDAMNRIKNGTATPEDFALTKTQPKTTDAVVASILEDHMAGRPLSPAKQQIVKDYLLNQRLKGLSGDAQLAMRAALGDTDAAKALERLKPGEKNMTLVEVFVQAEEVKAKMKANPGYQPTVREQAVMLTADTLLEQRGARPLPTKVADQFTSARTIFEHLNEIKELADKGALQYVGPVAGRTGRAAEAVGLHVPERAKLYHAIDGLLLEIGPSRFGAAFTAKEAEILSGFLTEANNPGQQFKTKLDAVIKMMDKKYADMVAVSKSNKYRIPEEFLARPGAESAPADNLKARIRELLLQGKTPGEIKAILGGSR